MAARQIQVGQRCRTGCWTCKGRRVKCSEERPTCSTCRRLGLSCQYGIKLLWREDALSRGIALGRSGAWSKTPSKVKSGLRDKYDMSVLDYEYLDMSGTIIQDWMFLNTTYGDFQDPVDSDKVSSRPLLDSGSPNSLPQPLNISNNPSTFVHEGNSHESQASYPTDFDLPDSHLENSRDVLARRGEYPDDLLHTGHGAIPQTDQHLPLFSLIGHTLSPFVIGRNELYLLDYFTSSLSPRCILWPTDNPFNNTIIPICLSAPTKPLFYTVMAVASHQLFLLNDDRFERDIWLYRAKALEGFQEDIRHFGDHQDSPGSWEQVVSTLIMLAFFDISQNGSSTWLVHLRCARSLLALLPSPSQLSAEQASIRRFFSSYFIEHEALARTASNLGEPFSGTVSWLSPELDLDMTVIDSVLGCSHEVISLISTISDLAEEQKSLQCMLGLEQGSTQAVKEKLQNVQVRRNDIERALYTLRQVLPPAPTHTALHDEEVAASMEELSMIAETRRLSALIYLYYRLDGIRATDLRIARLTSKILSLIPKISLRSHAVLWELYVVGTMGLGLPVGEAGDADRKFVLERLVSLQGTRHLRNVRQAREAVEAIWKARDLGGPDAEEGGWSELIAVRGQGVSLC